MTLQSSIAEFIAHLAQ